VKKIKRGHLKLTCTTKVFKDGFEVKLKVIEGRELMACDFNGFSDPYVKMYLEPDSDKSTKKKTAVVNKSLNPMYNEEFTWKLPSSANLKKIMLTVSVWDYDRFNKNDFMGMMAFNLFEVLQENTVHDGWFILLDDVQGKSNNFPTRGDDVARFESGSTVQRVEPKKAAAPKVPVAAAAAPSAGAPKKYSADDFTFLKVLGKGSFGKVFLAEEKSTKNLYDVKALKKLGIVKDNSVADTLTERRVLSLPGNPLFMIQVKASFQTPQNLFFVMNLVNGGDLMFHVLKAGTFSEKQSIFYTAEISCGLWFMHERGILYRDLKLDNVMIDSEGHVKVADFGLCKEGIIGDAGTWTFCGTPDYIAPEIVQHKKYGNSIDWWSLGVLVYEMMTGEAPFDGQEEETLFRNIVLQPISYKRWLSKEAILVLKGFLTRDPLTRLGCGPTGKADIMAHKFFRSLDWDLLQARKIPPPLVPKIGNPRDAENFDTDFTAEKPCVSPENPKQIAAIDQTLFQGFSFVNA
jgi:classical protein kinase C